MCFTTLLVSHLSVLLQRDGTIVIGVVHVEEDWKEKKTFAGQARWWGNARWQNLRLGIMGFLRWDQGISGEEELCQEHRCRMSSIARKEQL